MLLIPIKPPANWLKQASTEQSIATQQTTSNRYNRNNEMWKESDFDFNVVNFIMLQQKCKVCLCSVKIISVLIVE